MAQRYLLDTNIVSALVVDPHGKVASKALAVGEARLFTSVIVACELRFGATKKGSPRLTAQLDAVLGTLPVLGLERSVEAHYAKTRQHLERTGRIIGQNDLLIAAHALALDAVVVTDNDREFRRVPHLTVENWLRRR